MSLPSITTALQSGSSLIGLGIQADASTECAQPLVLARTVGNNTLTPNIEDYEELHGGDSRAFGTPTIGRGKVGGDAGGFDAQATPRLTAIAFAAMLGKETVDGTTHVRTATDADSVPYLAFFKHVGEAGLSVQERYNLSRVKQLTLTAGVSQKIARLGFQVMSLDPAEVYTTAIVPEHDDLASEPWWFTDVEGAITLPGIGSLGKLNTITVTVADGVGDWQGDSVRSCAVIEGRKSVVIGGTLLLDAKGLEAYNLHTYGKATVAHGDRPAKGLYQQGGFAARFANATEYNDFSLPNGLLRVNTEIAGNPEGGVVEVPFTIRSLPGASADALKVESKTADTVSYLA